MKKNKVFIATSIDGYISDVNGGIDWLNKIPIPENIDMGYSAFMDSIDAIIMGRNTFETVCGFNIDWPYDKQVFVLSNTLSKVESEYSKNATIINGNLHDVLEQIHQQGYYQLYIDGGVTIQNFLKEDLIDEMIISIIPTLLGGGNRLFNSLSSPLDFELVNSKIYLNAIVQNHFIRINQANDLYYK